MRRNGQAHDDRPARGDTSVRHCGDVFIPNTATDTSGPVRDHARGASARRAFAGGAAARSDGPARSDVANNARSGFSVRGRARGDGPACGNMAVVSAAHGNMAVVSAARGNIAVVSARVTAADGVGGAYDAVACASSPLRGQTNVDAAAIPAAARRLVRPRGAAADARGGGGEDGWHCCCSGLGFAPSSLVGLCARETQNLSKMVDGRGSTALGGVFKTFSDVRSDGLI